MPTPDSDLATKLATALSLTVNTNVFAGPVRPVGARVPAKAIFCLAGGGLPPIPFLGTSTDVRQSAVQVRIRTAVADGYGTGLTFARSVLTACQRASVSGYVTALVSDSEPAYLGQDDLGNFEWSLNVRMVWTG